MPKFRNREQYEKWKAKKMKEAGMRPEPKKPGPPSFEPEAGGRPSFQPEPPTFQPEGAPQTFQPEEPAFKPEEPTFRPEGEAGPTFRSETVPSQLEGETTWAMFCHLSALSGFIIPFGNFLGPLIVWLIKKNESDLVNDQGKESLFFQLTILLMAIGVGIISFLMMLGGIMLGAFLFVILMIVPLYSLVMIIIAGIKAKEGEYFRYPFTARF